MGVGTKLVNQLMRPLGALNWQKAEPFEYAACILDMWMPQIPVA